MSSSTSLPSELSSDDEESSAGGFETVDVALLFGGGGPDDHDAPLPTPLFFLVEYTLTLAELGTSPSLPGVAACSETIAVNSAMSPIGGAVSSSSDRTSSGVTSPAI